jgi:hypothetical protein
VRLLLDCHISRATVPALRKRLPFLHSEHLAAWRAGEFLRAADEDILSEWHRERRVFVTFDQRTIPDLLRLWAAEGRSHSGVVFGDERSVKPSQPGAVTAAIARLVAEIGNSDTTNLIRYLRPASAG